MKKIVALCVMSLVLAPLLCACADTGISRGTAVTTVSGQTKSSLFEQTVFAVDKDADDAVFAAAQSFCRRVNALSKSGLTLTAVRSENALDELENGKASLALVGGGTAASLHPFFEIANENFRYKSYEHFSVSCNSAPVLKMLSDRAGLTVFGAYYTGSACFISNGALESVLLTPKSDSVDNPPAVFTRLPPRAADALSFLDLKPEKAALISQRLQPVEKENTAAEVVFGELPLLLLPNSQVFGGDFPDELTLTRTFHSIEPLWLMLEPSFYNNLPPPERASIDEAAAFMTADIDHVFLVREEESITSIGDANMSVSDDPALIVARILRNKNRSLSGLSADERNFRRLLDSIV